MDKKELQTQPTMDKIVFCGGNRILQNNRSFKWISLVAQPMPWDNITMYSLPKFKGNAIDGMGARNPSASQGHELITSAHTTLTKVPSHIQPMQLIV